MFTYKLMDSRQAREMTTELHDRHIEINLSDASTTIPVRGELDRKPSPCVLPFKYLEYAERIRNLTVYEDDVWIVTFPKSGTTWTQEMVWLIDHDLDYETAGKVDLNVRTVFIEASAVIGDYLGDTVGAVENLIRPRHIKSHLPLALLPEQLWTVKPKIIYCARNPKDVAVSYMHHYRHLHGFNGTDEAFLEGLLNDQVLWCPQVPHTLDFWSVRHLDNVLFNQFEEMIKDIMGVLRKTCSFFKKSYTDEQLVKLAEHLSFDMMKRNPSANHTQLLKTLETVRNTTINFSFMRKGQVGCYKDELTPEFTQRLQEHVDRQLAGSSFQYME
nr:sulfotransferase 1A1-like [Aedes albopictus]